MTGDGAVSDTPKYGNEKGGAAQGGLFEAPLTKEGPAGHRKRMRARLRRGGPDAMPDYEMLEMILFRALPRRDTKQIAKRLLARFGTFADVINASEVQLKEVKDVGDAVVSEFQLIRAAALRLGKTQLSKRPILSSWKEVISYLTAAQAFEKKEQFRVLFLDRKNRLITDEMQSEGTVNHAPVYVREVVKRALDHSASAILLVHNHPSGDPTPSRVDIEMTQQICEAAKPLGITVHDHIIIGRDGHTSFRNLRLLS